MPVSLPTYHLVRSAGSLLRSAPLGARVQLVESHRAADGPAVRAAPRKTQQKDINDAGAVCEAVTPRPCLFASEFPRAPGYSVLASTAKPPCEVAYTTGQLIARSVDGARGRPATARQPASAWLAPDSGGREQRADTLQPASVPFFPVSYWPGKERIEAIERLVQRVCEASEPCRRVAPAQARRLVAGIQ